MTFENAAWAIDGAQMDSALARRAMYAGSRNPGIVKKNDLKVQELSTPGVGFRIASGVGLILNDYQTAPNEMYVVSNPSTHTFPSIDMPPSSGSAKHYLVAIVVGDPAFSQSGHPWMGAGDPPDGDELTFQYVRPTLIECSAGETTLDEPYPALVLARIDFPAGTNTVTDARITDLRSLSLVRQAQYAFVSPNTAWGSSVSRIPSGSSYGNWGSGEYAPSVDVPEWAKRAIVLAHVNGVRLDDVSASVQGKIRVKLGTVTSPETKFDYSIGGGAIRDNLMCGGGFDVEDIAGTSATLRVEGFENVPASPSSAQKLTLTSGSAIIFDVRFFEE